MVLGLSNWLLASALTGVALAFVGLYVARMGKGDHANRAFGFYAAGFGFGAALSNAQETTLVLPDGVLIAGYLLQAALLGLGLVSLVVFALSFPRVLPKGEHHTLLWPALVFAAAALAHIPYEIWLARQGSPVPVSPSVLVSALFANVVFDMLRVALLAAAVLFALRFRSMRNDPSGDAQRIALVAAALTIYPMAFTGWASSAALIAGDVVRGSPLLIDLAVLAGLTILWLANTRSATHHASARNVALVGWAAALVGVLYQTLEAPISPSGLMRVVEIMLIAYAVVRYQLLGIDVKIRWGISRGTVGAVFVGVFFVVSEAAQVFFSARTNSTVVGIVAAGGLVFALAPLQRAADTLAARAVPLAPPTMAAAAVASPIALYRQQVELAWTDGRISANERVMLRGLRQNLGLDANAADAIEHEVETARMARD